MRNADPSRTLKFPGIFLVACLLAGVLPLPGSSAMAHGRGGGGGHRGFAGHGGGHFGGHGGWGWRGAWFGGFGIGLGAPYFFGGWPYYDFAYDPLAVYADPQPLVPTVPAAPLVSPAASTWYYCDNPAGYYPYVRSCSVLWRAVPAVPPASH